ncbi:MAG TPA: EAL domain-containing protein [Rugosimonospora sp.]|jgi:diguanylate cyclase (GGDEF)-like protein
MDEIGDEPPAMTVGAVARPVAVVDSRVFCEDLDRRFRADLRLSCVVVRAGARDIGLVGRQSFAHLMSGPFGYGRALWARTPVGLVADWHPLIVPADASVVEACEWARQRDRDRRYDDVIVVDPQLGLRRVSAARLFEALAHLMAVQAVTDPLSGLINRARFLDRLDAACREAGTDRVVVGYLDLDRMKQVNDALGHNAGDRLIVSAARRLTYAARANELVARIGGDEFAVLGRLPAHRAVSSVAMAIGERFRAALADTDATLPVAAHSRASVGVAVSGARADPHPLLTEADMAMYQAKQQGGDAVRVVIGVGEHLDAHHPGAGHGLARAISSGELTVHYQPIVDLRADRVAGVEALVRWRHPRHGLLGPDAFLADAERANQLPALDRWILARACADAASWTARLGPLAPTFLNVNLTVDTLRAADFDAHIASALAGSGLHPARLCLELPESADLTVLTDAVPGLRRLRALGVGITLDDMGAGSSTLRHLSVLPITGIKIDKLFVGGMVKNRSDHAVVKLLTDLGRNLNLAVTAEGVEQSAQLMSLRTLNVPHAQGFLLSPPRPADDLVRLLTGQADVAGAW